MTTVPPIPSTEQARLAVLDSYGILDTPPERAFDDLTRLAGQLLGAPIAAVNLGRTRADDLISLKIEACAEQLLPRVVQLLDAHTMPVPIGLIRQRGVL